MTIDERLAHLKSEEIQDLMKRYYNKENVSKLINEYKINITPTKLCEAFPPRNSEEVCPYCHSPMFIKMSPRTQLKYIEKKNFAYCEACGHIDSVDCTCSECQNERRLLSEKAREEHQKEIEEKRRIISYAYNTDAIEKIEAEELTFRDRVYLGALLRLAMDEDMKKIKPISEIKLRLAPTEDYINEIIEHLISRRIIVVDPDSSINAFPAEGFPNRYYISEVVYIINLGSDGSLETQINEIINPEDIKEEDMEDAYNIWKRIAFYECLEYLYFQMNEVKFEYHAGPKTFRTILDMQENFATSQIFSIIGRSVSNAAKYFLSGKVTRKQAANTVVGRCQNYAERALIEKWDVMKYHRPYLLPQSVLSEFFFYRVIKVGELGFNMPPTHFQELPQVFTDNTHVSTNVNNEDLNPKDLNGDKI